MILNADLCASSIVAYGDLGRDGALGFDGLRVSVCGHQYTRVLCAHPPSRMVFHLDGEQNQFHCYAALNDTSAEGVHADFLVYADDTLVACAPRVRRAHHMRAVSANIRGAKKLELVIEADPCEFVHALWVDPVLDRAAVSRISSPLGEQYAEASHTMPAAEKCIVVIVTPDFVDMTSNMLGSLYANGGVRDANVALVAFGHSPELVSLAARHGATLFQAHGHDGSTFKLKAMAYVAAQLFDASSYMVLDADLLVLKSVSALFESLDSAPKDAVLICREQGLPSNVTLWDGMFGGQHPYYGDPSQATMFGATQQEYGKCQVVNAGVFACSRRALLGVENLIRDLMPQSAAWEAMSPDIKWREQGVFNAALARYGNIQEISPVYNVQLAKSHPDIRREAQGATKATHQDEVVKVLHFNGSPGKAAYEMFASDYTTVADPKFGRGALGSDFYRFGHAIFRAAYEPSVCNAFDSEESFWPLSGLYHEVYKRLETQRPERLLDVNSYACGLAAVGAHYAAKYARPMWGVRRGPYPSELSARMETAVSGDVEATLIKWKEGGELFDCFLLDTSVNIRHFSVCMQVIMPMMSPSATLYLHDACNPACEIEAVLQKCRVWGLEVAQVARPGKTGSTVYEVKRGINQA